MLLLALVIIVAQTPARPTAARAPDRATGVLLFQLDSKYLAIDPSKGVKQPEDPEFRLTSPENGVNFDIDGDGNLDQVAWTEAGAEVAFLAVDVDDDGQITSGKELVGTGMVASSVNGVDALIQMFKATEKGLSGSVHEGHTLYEKLLLWTDTNHNGVSEPSELRLAKGLFAAVGMGYYRYGQVDDHGNRFRFQGWVELRTGGVEQTRANNPREQRPRVRNYHEVALKTR